MPDANILVVNDEDSIRHFVSRSLKDDGYNVRSAGTALDARAAFADETPDLVILDMKLGQDDGLELLAEFKGLSPETVVIVITAFGETETAVKAMSLGAFYFLKKPLQLDELNTIVGRGIDQQRLSREVHHLRQAAMDSEGYVECVSPAMRRLYEQVGMVATGETTSVLVEGESGSGKEMIARLIHQQSERASKPFVEVNCAAIPKDLLESELFGHEKGAFTDARAQKQGLLELANGGTLFLDEIGEMPVQLQVKLLRVLERMTFKRVGGVKDIQVSVRIVSATNQDLLRLVETGGFREDLYYRLNVVSLRVPPLRERDTDILPLANHFRERFNLAFKKTFSSFSREAEEMIREYAWPGNVRELRMLQRSADLGGDAAQPAIERAVALRPSCGQCVSMLASTSLASTPPSRRLSSAGHGTLPSPSGTVRPAARSRSLRWIAVTRGASEAMSSSLGRSPVAQALAMSTRGRR